MNSKDFDKLHICDAISYATQSTCCSNQVGCVVVSEDNEVISVGSNGVPLGKPCYDVAKENKWVYNGVLLKKTRPKHSEWSDGNEVHAEMVALLSNNAISPYNKLTIYVTASPCANCMKHILFLNENVVEIKRIVYLDLYDRNTVNYKEIEQESGISIEQFNRDDLPESFKNIQLYHYEK